MTRQELFEQIKAKRSFLCVGLDTDFQKIPLHLRRTVVGADGKVDYERISKVIFEFNKSIIDATARYAVAYKPNLAFYEVWADKGSIALSLTLKYIRDSYPEIFVISDAKRGDIGNTSDMYAKASFDLEEGETSFFDAVTLAPYMGRDTVEPFLAEKYDGKWAVVLALTSNPSADDFETLRLEGGEFLWQRVLRTAAGWGCEPHGRSNNLDRMMFVVGATRAEMLAEVREIVPDHFLLVPGVGAQGGSLEEVAKYGMNRECGLLVNSSRGIIYASSGEDFAAAAAAEARKLAAEMGALLDKYL